MQLIARIKIIPQWALCDENWERENSEKIPSADALMPQTLENLDNPFNFKRPYYETCPTGRAVMVTYMSKLAA